MPQDNLDGQDEISQLDPWLGAPDPRSPLPQAPPLLHLGPANAAPFDFMNFMAKTGGSDIQACLKDKEHQMQDYPVHEAGWTFTMSIVCSNCRL